MSVTLPAATPTTAPGVDHECDDRTCCGLATLARPRFFCGQLLTDTDLTAFVEWTADKLRLNRYRTGWGVVCGLDVHCDPDPAMPGGVIVTPGYAISCCGDDIVVDAPYHKDLRGACRVEQPCEPGYGQAPTTEPPAPEVVDLYLCYREEDAAPQTALARRTCGEGGACEPSRRKERFGVTWRPVVGDKDPVTAAAEQWEHGYDHCLDVATSYGARFTAGGTYDDDRRASIAKYLRGYPVHQFGFVRDRIRDLPGRTEKTDEAYIARLIFFLVQDYRNAYLACSCHACDDTPGVPLARVWLDRTAGGECRIQRVDPYPPYRRPLSRECWPAAPGSVNVGQVIWHRWEQACTTLADLGVRVVGTETVAIPQTVAGVVKTLTCPPFVRCGDRVVVQVAVYEGERRVIGFCGAPVDNPRTVAEELAELERVPGIGPEYARTLHAAGFTTLAALGRASVEDVRPLFKAIVTPAQLESWIRSAGEQAGP